MYFRIPFDRDWLERHLRIMDWKDRQLSPSVRTLA